MDVPHPDEKSIITYVSSLYDVMPRVPDVQDGIKANVSFLHPVHFIIPPRYHLLLMSNVCLCVFAAGAGAALAGVL